MHIAHLNHWNSNYIFADYLCKENITLRNTKPIGGTGCFRVPIAERVHLETLKPIYATSSYEFDIY